MLLMGVGGGAAAFAPTDVAGLKAWYKADALALNDGDAVASWTDSSGNGNHATEATNKPTYKTNIQNGLPALLGDGTNDVLTKAGLGTGWGSSVGSMFVVYNANGDTGFGIVSLTGAADEHWRFSGDGNGYLATFRSARLIGQPASVPATGANLWTIISGTSTYKVWKNSATLAVNTTTSWGVGADMKLFFSGGAGYLAGYIMEVIMYNTEVSDANRLLIEAYLNTRWAVY